MRRPLLLPALLSCLILVGVASGATILGNSGTTIDVRFTGYNCGETHTFTDELGQTVTGTTNPCPPPTADFTWAPAAPIVGESVTFTCITDTGIACRWDIDGDRVPEAELPPSQTYSFSYQFTGNKIPCVQTVGAGGLVSAWVCHTFSVAAGSPPPPPPPPNLGGSLPARMPESSGNTWVAAFGASGSTCSAASPCSLSTAWGSKATSGDTINLRGGTYSGVFILGNKTFSTANPVTIQSYPSETATFTGTGSFGTNAFNLEYSTGVRVRNITFAARKNTNVKVTNAKHIEFDKILSRDSGRDGVSVGQGGMGLLVVGNASETGLRSEDVQVWNSIFTNNGGQSTGSAGSENHDHAIYLGGGQATGNTATAGGCVGFVIANDLFFDSPAGYTVQLGGAARDGVVTNNTFYNVTTSAAVSGSQIVVWSPNYGGYGTQNVRITNNIFSKQNGHAVDTSLGWNPPGNLVVNNLAWIFETPAYYPIYGSYTGFTVGTNLPAADPLFVAPTGTFGSLTGRNFHLQSGSPALGQSDPAFTPPFDLDDNARPVAPALGAFG
jgi:hypothetical protein